MESQPLASGQTGSINHAKIYQHKWMGIISIVLLSIISAVAASRTYHTWSRTSSDGFGLVVVVLMVLLPYSAFYVAWGASRRTSPDPAIRRAVMWTTLYGISTVLFSAYILMMLVKDVYSVSSIR